MNTFRYTGTSDIPKSPYWRWIRPSLSWHNCIHRFAIAAAGQNDSYQVVTRGEPGVLQPGVSYTLYPYYENAGFGNVTLGSAPTSPSDAVFDLWQGLYEMHDLQPISEGTSKELHVRKKFQVQKIGSSAVRTLAAFTLPPFWDFIRVVLSVDGGNPPAAWQFAGFVSGSTEIAAFAANTTGGFMKRTPLSDPFATASTDASAASFNVLRIDDTDAALAATYRIDFAIRLWGQS